MENNKKIIISIPCLSTIKSLTTASLIYNVINTDFEVDFVIRMNADIIGARTWLVRNAIKKGASHILFVDYDMFFPADTITKLVNHDKDIIGAPYNFREFPLHSTAIPLDTPPNEFTVYAKDFPKTLFKCLCLGTGLLLIKTSVFDKIPEPWFQFGRNKEGELVQGEDAYFSYKAREAGFDIWCDPNIGARHVGEYLF